ncbi:hypothetical protein GJ744_003769 [Endocarpon pusillum]|uniref:Uncharacterized protein n=1 Tax=Endocarpon pusillum TaxID=364733 RepID=A0A8H7AR10_9EURO|nr:hypothetical protein GJ744_003769 [Endocarpon pusillum]
MDSLAIIFNVVIDCFNLFENLTGQNDDDLAVVVVKYRDASADPGDSDGETIRAIQKHFSKCHTSALLLTPVSRLTHAYETTGKQRPWWFGLLH